MLIGAVLGLARRPAGKVVGLVMAFGSGVLISALAFELVIDPAAPNTPYNCADATTAPCRCGQGRGA